MKKVIEQRVRILRLAGVVFLLGLPALTVVAETQAQDRAPDPAATLFSVTLNPDEKKSCRALFEQLASVDFETRESALQRLVARGPAVLPLAAEFAGSQDAEAAEQAKGLRGKILLQYDGYLPADPSLQEKLQQRITADRYGDPRERLLEVAKEYAVPVFWDSRFKSSGATESVKIPFKEGPLGIFLAEEASRGGLTTLLRGDVLLVTSGEEAQRLERQRQLFSWKSLGLDRTEAERVGHGLKAFFPEGLTELHTGSEALSVRGPSAAIPRAARLIALLKPGAGAALWPAPKKEWKPSESEALLAKPVKLILNRDDLTDALSDLQKQGFPVRVLADGKAFNDPPYPEEIRGLAPITLSLRGVPLGLALRWLVKRTAFVGAHANERALHAEAGDDGRAQLRLGPKARELLGLCVGGSDATFLWPPGTQKEGGEKADRAAREKLVTALRPQMELFPNFEIEQDLRVLRGRALMQGTAASVARALELLRLWKEQGQAPLAPWMEGFTALLDRPQDWDGRGLTAGRLLPRLRALSSATILLEDSPDGEAPHFKLAPEQAQLLPPGKHTLRELLDDLAAKAGACWEIRWGVMVISPAPKRSSGTAEAGKREAPANAPRPEVAVPAP